MDLTDVTSDVLLLFSVVIDVTTLEEVKALVLISLYKLIISCIPALTDSN